MYIIKNKDLEEIEKVSEAIYNINVNNKKNKMAYIEEAETKLKLIKTYRKATKKELEENKSYKILLDVSDFYGRYAKYRTYFRNAEIKTITVNKITTKCIKDSYNRLYKKENILAIVKE